MINTFLASIHALFMEADVIHYQGIGPSLFAWIPRLFSRKSRVIATFHCQDYFHQKWGPLARCMFRIGEFVACSWTHKTIVVSKILKRFVKQRYGRNAVYIPNAVTIQKRLVPNKIKRYGLERGSYILCVSRLVKHKGVHYVISAYDALSKQMKQPPKLVIVGDGTYTNSYVKQLKGMAAGNRHIIFTGELSGSVLAELYSNARLFVQASESEGLSLSILEAMSFGCPVLVSDIAENKEILPAVGHTFQNKNVEDLIYQLNIILHSRRQVSPSVAQIEYVKKNYNFDIVFEKAVRLYQQQSEA